MIGQQTSPNMSIKGMKARWLAKLCTATLERLEPQMGDREGAGQLRCAGQCLERLIALFHDAPANPNSDTQKARIR